jgi:hypothetical protein
MNPFMFYIRHTTGAAPGRQWHGYHFTGNAVTDVARITIHVVGGGLPEPLTLSYTKPAGGQPCLRSVAHQSRRSLT